MQCSISLAAARPIKPGVSGIYFAPAVRSKRRILRSKLDERISPLRGSDVKATTVGATAICRTCRVPTALSPSGFNTQNFPKPWSTKSEWSSTSGKFFPAINKTAGDRNASGLIVIQMGSMDFAAPGGRECGPAISPSR